MRRTMIAVAVAAFAAGAVTVGTLRTSVAQDGSNAFGWRESYLAEEAYDLELGVTVTGRPGLPVRFKESRRAVAVPAFYGDLKNITQDGHDSVLWFCDKDGVLRNTVVPNTANTPVEIVRATEGRRETRLR